MLAATLLSLAVDAPTTADGWVRVINIKPSVDGSCPGDLQYSAPMKVYGLVTPTGESYRALTPV